MVDFCTFLLKKTSRKVAGITVGAHSGNYRTVFYGDLLKSSQVNTLPKAKSKTRSKQNKDMHKCSSVYSERGVPLPVLTSGGE